MPSAALIEELATVAARRLGGNLRLLGLYGSAAQDPERAHDLDFLLVVDAVENCVTHATRDCRDIYAQVQFFVVNAAEFAALPAFYRFQFAFVRPLHGNLALPPARREDAIESITHGFTDSLRTIRQQFKRREWAIADDWARQVWWNLKSFKYAELDVCWLLRGERPTDVERATVILESAGLDHAARAVSEWPTDVERATVILESAGLDHAARAVSEWPELEDAARQLKQSPIPWLLRWEALITAAYAEVRPLLRAK